MPRPQPPLVTSQHGESCHTICPIYSSTAHSTVLAVLAAKHALPRLVLLELLTINRLSSGRRDGADILSSLCGTGTGSTAQLIFMKVRKRGLQMMSAKQLKPDSTAVGSNWLAMLGKELCVAQVLCKSSCGPRKPRLRACSSRAVQNLPTHRCSNFCRPAAPEYSVRVTPHAFTTTERDSSEIAHRYSHLFISSDFAKLVACWPQVSHLAWA